jgi:hypothetical protein
MIERIPPQDQPDRNPGAYPQGRACSCGAILRTTNPGPRCAPCSLASMPAAELIANTLNSMEITPMPDLPDWAA